MFSSCVQSSPLHSPDFSCSFVKMHIDEFSGVIDVQSSVKVCFMLENGCLKAILTPGIARMSLATCTTNGRVPQFF